MTALGRVAILGALSMVASIVPALAQQGAADGQWRSYGGDDGSTKYAALDQISAGNVDRLEVAWRWESPDGAIAGENRRLTPGAFKATPLMVDGVLYIRTSLSIVAAIDAATGEQLWVRDVGSHEAGRPTNLGWNSRGVGYWSDDAESRIVHAVDVPAILTGTPMTYMAGGKQYIVAAHGAGPTAGLAALALP